MPESALGGLHASHMLSIFSNCIKRNSCSAHRNPESETRLKKRAQWWDWFIGHSFHWNGSYLPIYTRNYNLDGNFTFSFVLLFLRVVSIQKVNLGDRSRQPICQSFGRVANEALFHQCSLFLKICLRFGFTTRIATIPLWLPYLLHYANACFTITNYSCRFCHCYLY